MAAWETAPITGNPTPASGGKAAWEAAPMSVHPADLAHADHADPGLAMPDQEDRSYMGAPETPGAYGNNPMAQGAPEPPGPPLDIPDAFNAFASNMLRSPQIVGTGIESGMNNIKAAVHGTTPEQIAAESAASRERNPVASAIGGFTGAAVPYVLGGMYAPVAGALGLAGGLGSRLAMTGISQMGINTADNMVHGQPLGEAAKNAVIPSLESVPFAMLGKAPANASRDAAVKTLEDAGVPLSAGQRNDSRVMKAAEDELGGSSAIAFNEKQSEAFTKAALKTAGVVSTRATPEVIDKAFIDIGKKFDSLAARTTVPFDQTLQQDLAQTVHDYTQTSGMPAKVVETMANRIAELAQNGGGNITGEAYQNIRSELGRLSQSGAPETKGAMRDLQSALDDAVERSMPPRFVNQWKQVRKQYQNLLVVRDSVSGAGKEAVSGLITPAHIRTATASVFGKSQYARGAGDANELARAGVQILTPLSNSNTALRTAVRGGVPGALAIAGGLAGHDTAGYLGAALGALGGMAVPGVVGKAMLSGVGRTVLGSRGSSLPAAVARATLGNSGKQTMTLEEWMGQHQ